MKRYACKIIALLLLAIAFTACKKEHKLPVYATDHGTISLDYRACMTCGGYLIVFDKDTSTVYRSYQIPGNSGITSGTTFPVKATIGWKPDTSIKISNFITITSLKIDN
jgi:hypothetical protein